ncbi:chromosomal replication initiator protein DnaA, partial [Escherichia coli]|nr:chromosomal replication initiator protein DnaA [Escherichia coli]
LYAPNRLVIDWVRDKYINNINELLNDFCGTDAPALHFEVGNKPVTVAPAATQARTTQQVPAFAVPSAPIKPSWDNSAKVQPEVAYRSNVNPKHTFDNFVEGKSNQLARAAARQVAENPGG